MQSPPAGTQSTADAQSEAGHRVDPNLLPVSSAAGTSAWACDVVLTGPLAGLAARPTLDQLRTAVPGSALGAQDRAVPLGDIWEFLQLDALAPATALGPMANDALEVGLAALGRNETARAGAEFLRAAADGRTRPAAAQALGCTLVAAGIARPGLELAQCLLDAGLTHPAAEALAGWAAAGLGDEAQSRRHMARAARLCRGRPELRGLLRFVQKTLLIQSFGH